jgi:hypothetical protein
MHLEGVERPHTRQWDFPMSYETNYAAVKIQATWRMYITGDVEYQLEVIVQEEERIAVLEHRKLTGEVYAPLLYACPSYISECGVQY